MGTTRAPAASRYFTYWAGMCEENEPPKLLASPLSPSSCNKISRNDSSTNQHNSNLGFCHPFLGQDPNNGSWIEFHLEFLSGKGANSRCMLIDREPLLKQYQHCQLHGAPQQNPFHVATQCHISVTFSKTTNALWLTSSREGPLFLEEWTFAISSYLTKKCAIISVDCTSTCLTFFTCLCS